MTSRRLLWIGVALGAVAVVLMNLYLRAELGRGEAVRVYRLRPDASLAKGERVDPAQVEVIGVPEEFAELHTLAIPASREASAWLENRPASQDVAAGGVLLYAHFEDRPEQRFSASIEQGMRALSIPVDPSSAVSYFVEPGSRVDVLATMREQLDLAGPARGERVATRTLLQNLRVLAVGQATTRGSYLGASRRDFDTVTVEVTPRQAEKLVFALEHTEPRRALVLILRNPSDEARVELPTASWEALRSEG